MGRTTSVAACAAALVALFATAMVAHGEDSKPAAGKKTEPAPGKATTLRVYEWGVDRSSWDGSAVTPNDVPECYYSAEETPLGAPPEKQDPVPLPKPRSSPGQGCAKPVVYFQCDRDLKLAIEVKFLNGTVDWMYPKPSRRRDAATAQWDDVHMYSDSAKTSTAKLPAMAALPETHWANFSREGSQSTLSVNGETERFLFYEGTKADLPEIDVAQDAKGNVVLRNFGCCPVHDVRLRLQVEKTWRMWFVREIAAANGADPALVTLSDADQVNIDAARRAGELAVEARAAGLTETQGAVFERCWRDDFLMGDKGVLTFRHDQRWLDESVALTLTSSTKLAIESKRVGYVWLNDIDLKRQAEFDKLADALASGDTDAGDKLSKLGAAGAGAVRRLMSDGSQSLTRRLKLAAWMKKQPSGR